MHHLTQHWHMPLTVGRVGHGRSAEIILHSGFSHQQVTLTSTNACALHLSGPHTLWHHGSHGNTQTWIASLVHYVHVDDGKVMVI